MCMFKWLLILNLSPRSRFLAWYAEIPIPGGGPASVVGFRQAVDSQIIFEIGHICVFLGCYHEILKGLVWKEMLSRD